MTNLTLPPLYLVTDRHQVGETNFLKFLEELIPCGGFMLQLREKDLSIRALLQLATTISKWNIESRPISLRFSHDISPFPLQDRVTSHDKLLENLTHKYKTLKTR